MRSIKIAVLLLVVAALLVAGCTTSTTNTTNQTPRASATPSTSTHDAFLEKMLAEAETNTHSSKDMELKAWELTWINDTSARVQYTALNKSINTTYAADVTYIVFPTSQDATQYLNAMNKTEYSLASSIYPSVGAYKNATGHAPKIYKQYEWSEGSILDLSQYKLHQITQADNIIQISTAKILS